MPSTRRRRVEVTCQTSEGQRTFHVGVATGPDAEQRGIKTAVEEVRRIAGRDVLVSVLESDQVIYSMRIGGA